MKRLSLVFVALIFCFIPIVVFALSTFETGTFQATATGLTTTVSGSTNMNTCLVTLETCTYRYRFDGLSNPTSTIGHAGAADSSVNLRNVFEVRGFKAISTGAPCTYQSTCQE